MLYFVGLMVRMAIRPACIFFLFLLSLKCLAQTDSLYTDTVIIVQPPLVIKKQVHVPVTDYIKEESSIELGAYTSANWNLSPSANTKNGSFYSFGLQVRYNLGNAQVGLGMGTLQTSLASQQDIYTSDTTIRQDSSLQKGDCIFQIMNGELVELCFYDTVVNQVMTVNTSPQTLRQQGNIQYLQIPFSLAYHFKMGKWSLSPCLQAIYQKRVSLQDDFWQWKENSWLMGTEVRLSYLFHSHLLTEIKAEYKRNLTSINSNLAEKQQWNLFGLGIGIYYRF